MTNENETVREVCAEMCKDYYKMGRSNARLDTELMDCLKSFADRLLSAYEREMAAKDAEIARLKASLLTICTADKTAEGLREIAIDACNGKIAAHNRVAKAVREVKE